MAPLIGITTYDSVEAQIADPTYGRLYGTSAEYVEAVARAGGIPVMLAPGAAVGPLLDRMDGILFSGGADVEPARYGGDPAHPRLGLTAPARDAMEFELLDAVLARGDLPMLCICRGHQLLNVGLGGTLHEHIETISEGGYHRDLGTFWTDDPITVAPGTRLHAILGTSNLSGRSGHHQGIRDLAPGLRAAAHTPDGLVEAVEMPDHPFAIGVQWHPEVTAGQDPVQQRLFDAFVTAAGRAG